LLCNFSIIHFCLFHYFFILCMFVLLLYYDVYNMYYIIEIFFSLFVRSKLALFLDLLIKNVYWIWKMNIILSLILSKVKTSFFLTIVCDLRLKEHFICTKKFKWEIREGQKLCLMYFFLWLNNREIMNECFIKRLIAVETSF